MRLIKFLTAVILILSLGSCERELLFGCIEPEGNVETRDFDFGSFDELTIGVDSKVTIIESSKNSVTITAAVNILDRIDRDSEKSGDALSIAIDGCFKINNDEVTIIVEMVSVQRLTISGDAELVSESVLLTPENLILNISGDGVMTLNIEEANNISASIFGDGEIDIAGDVSKINVSISGDGVFQGERLFAEVALIRVSGDGDALINVSESIDIDLSGDAEVDVFGTADLQEIKISGDATVRNQGLISQDTYIDMSGEGEVEVQVNNILDIKVSGSGKVCYVGTPQLVLDISGDAKVSECE